MDTDKYKQCKKCGGDLRLCFCKDEVQADLNEKPRPRKSYVRGSWKMSGNKRFQKRYFKGTKNGP